MSRYNEFHVNYIKAFETLRELYWEAKRAPSTAHTMLVNPYRRQKLIRKFYGKDAATRKLMREKLREANKKHIEVTANKMME